MNIGYEIWTKGDDVEDAARNYSRMYSKCFQLIAAGFVRKTDIPVPLASDVDQVDPLQGEERVNHNDINWKISTELITIGGCCFLYLLKRNVSCFCVSFKASSFSIVASLHLYALLRRAFFHLYSWRLQCGTKLSKAAAALCLKFLISQLLTSEKKICYFSFLSSCTFFAFSQLSTLASFFFCTCCLIFAKFQFIEG